MLSAANLIPPCRPSTPLQLDPALQLIHTLSLALNMNQTYFFEEPTCNAAAHILQAQLQDVLPIQGDGALQGLHQTEQGHDEGGLATAGASDNADLLASRDVKGDTLQGD